MTSDEWFDEVVGHIKAAAGMPADHGTRAAPLSDEAELEDAPEPPRVSGPTTSEQLLPFGRTVRIKVRVTFVPADGTKTVRRTLTVRLRR